MPPVAAWNLGETVGESNLRPTPTSLGQRDPAKASYVGFRAELVAAFKRNELRISSDDGGRHRLERAVGFSQF